MSSPVERWLSLDEQAQALAARGEESDDAALLMRAEGCWRTALPLAPPVERSRLDGNLASAQRSRALLQGDLEAIGEAAVRHRRARAAAATEVERGMHEFNLGLDLYELARQRGDAGAIDAAIDAHRSALAREHDPADQALYLGGLADALAQRALAEEDDRAREEAIDRYREALAASPDAADRAHLLQGLGLALAERYQAGGTTAELDSAVQALRDAIAAMDSPRAQLALGDLHELRFEATGEPRERAAARSAWRRARGHGVGESQVASRFDGTAGVDRGANRLMARALRDGRWADLEAAIDRWHEALAAPVLSRRQRAVVQAGLANALAERAARTGTQKGLREALGLRAASLEWLPPRSRAVTLADQATDVLRADAGTPDDALTEALALTGEALNLAPAGSPERLTVVSARAHALRERFRRFGDDSDLDAAIACWEEAAPLADPFTAALLLDNVAAALVERHARSRNASDLDRALSAQGAVLAGIPAESDERIVGLSNLGWALHRRWEERGDASDLEHAVARWEEAASLLSRAGARAAVGYALGLEHEWKTLWAPLVEGLNQLAVISSPETRTSCRWRALAAAESGKARLLTRTVGLGDLDLPADIPANVTTHERDLRAELRALDDADMGRLDTRGARAAHRERVRAELEGLWEQMSALGPAAAEYVALRRGSGTDVGELKRLASELGRTTAIVALFAGSDRAWAFVLRGDQPSPVVVSVELGEQDWETILLRLDWQVANYDPVEPVRETWDDPLAPWLSVLGPHVKDAAHVILSPHGAGQLFPWAVLAQRAGWQPAEGNAMPVATVPSLGIVARLRARPLDGAGALVAGDPKGDLEFAAEEARAVAHTLRTSALIGPAATKDRLLDLMTDANTVHLATHAFFAPGSPLDSGLVTAAGVITARELLERRIRADLVVISACQSGIGGAIAGAELAGLAHALLHAGARALVVSLWDVDDELTGRLMRSFHECRVQGLDAAAALAKAMADTAAGGLPTRYWAGFAFVGAW